MIGPFVSLLIAMLLAGFVHLVTVLALPWLAPRDGYVRLTGLARENRMVMIPADEVMRTLPFADPAEAMAVCAYNLERGPVRIRLATGPAPVSLSFLRKGAGIYQSLSDRAATQGVLDAVVVTPAQMEKIQSLDSDDEPVQEIRVVSSDEHGLVLVRGLVPVASQRGEIERVLAASTCEAELLSP